MIIDIQAVITYRLMLKGKRLESVYKLREPISVDIPDLSGSEAPIACRIQDGDEDVVLRTVGGRLVGTTEPVERISAYPGDHGLQYLRSHGAVPSFDDLEIRQIIATDKEQVSAEIQKNAQDFVFVDGVLHRGVREPVIIRRRMLDGDSEFFEFTLNMDFDNSNALSRRETVAIHHIYGIAEFEQARHRIVGPSDVGPVIDLRNPDAFRYNGRTEALAYWAKLTLDEAKGFLGASTRDFAECFFALRDLVEAMDERPGSVSLEELVPCLEAIAEAPGRDGKPTLGGRSGNLALVRHYQETGAPAIGPDAPEPQVTDPGPDHAAPMI